MKKLLRLSVLMLLLLSLYPVTAQDTGVLLFTLQHDDDEYDDTVNKAMWNNDESRIMTTSSDHTVRVWDAQTGEQLLLLQHDSIVNGAAWSNDESRILSWARDGTARVWDAEKGEQLALLSLYSWVYAQWNADNSRILSMELDEPTVTVSDAETGEALLVLDHESDASAPKWNSDESRIITSTEDKVSFVWDAETGEQLMVFENVSSAKWNANDSIIMTTSRDGTARLWDAETGEQLLVLQHDESEYGVFGAIWNSDESQILTNSNDGTARLWDAQTGEQLFLWRFEYYPSIAVWNDDESLILTRNNSRYGCTEGCVYQVQIWDAETGEEVLTLDHPQEVRGDISISRDKSRVMTACRDGKARIWDMESGKVLLTMSHSDYLWGATWNSDESRVLTWSADGTAKLWDVSSVMGPSSLSLAIAQDDGTWLPENLDTITADNADQITQLARWGQGSIGNVNWADETITITNTTGMWLYDSTNLDAPPRFVDIGYINNAVFSRNPTFFAIAETSKPIELHSLMTGELLLELEGERSLFSPVVLSATGNRLAVANESRIQLWDITNDGDTVAAEALPTLELEDEPRRLALSSDGTRLATGYEDGTIALWDVATLEQLNTLEGHTDKIEGLLFHPDGNHLVSRSADETVRLWNGDSGEEIIQITPAFKMYSMALKPDGSSLAISGSGQVQLFFIDLEDEPTWGIDILLEGDIGSTISPIAFSPDGQALIAADEAENGYVWDTTTGQVLAIMDDFTDQAAAALSPDGRLLAVGGDFSLSGAHTVHVLDMETGDVLHVLDSTSTDRVTSLAFNPQGTILAVGTSLGAEIWNTSTWEKLDRCGFSIYYPHSMAFDNAGTTLALVNGWDNQVELWHVDIEGAAPVIEEQLILEGFKEPKSVIFSPDDTILFVGSDEDVRLFDPSDGQELGLWQNATDVLGMDISPDGTTLATTQYLAGKTHLWNVETGALRTQMDIWSRVYTVGYHPDGTLLAVGYRDGSIRLWDTRTGTEVVTLQGHNTVIWRVFFSPDGTMLISAGSDGTVRRWGVEATVSNTPSTTATTNASEIVRVESNDDWTPVVEAFNNMNMVLVPPGCFDMGSSEEQIDVGVAEYEETYCNGNCPEVRDYFAREAPQSPICFDTPFWIDQTEITRSMYDRCVRLGGCVSTPESEYVSEDTQPVNRITWFEAVEYCQWRGSEFRLPTEAEWEYAARGPDNLVYPWGNDFVDNNVVYADNSNMLAAEVASRANGVSWVGAYDLSGNMWEWVNTVYSEYPYDAGDGRERYDDSSDRVLRGGSFAAPDTYALRSATRFKIGPDYLDDDLSFRCVRDFGSTDEITLSDSDEPRTYYDSLTLGTPQQAVLTFVDAFRRVDFSTVFLIFSWDTQMAIQQKLNLLRHEDLVDPRIAGLVLDYMPRLNEMVNFEPSYWFDNIMLMAAQHDALLIDLRGDIEIIGEAHFYNDEMQHIVDVIAKVEGIEGEVIFRTLLAPLTPWSTSRSWRIIQVIVPRGVEESVPWSVPPPIVLTASAFWETPCDNTPPDHLQYDGDQPYIEIEPACGDYTNEGSESIELRGFNFEPTIVVEISIIDAEGGNMRADIDDQPIITDDNGEFTITLAMGRTRNPPENATLEIIVTQTFARR